ncbi:MAG: hypothetical protein KatS3mg131_0591 [Candidatus Tectimicrobiota bacterium]|nr:MAG: hypothetical protein KatS3mg131_0591 [Candidatus Tectomicrobia bacterium]
MGPLRAMVAAISMALALACPGRHQVVDQPHRFGLGGRHVAAGENHLLGKGGPDDARQQLRAANAGENAPASLQERQNTAVSLATMKSESTASSQPPPMA